MHRSGTSAIARALKVFDIQMGDDFIPAAENINPKGFWEDKDINALNIEMMMAINIGWDSLTPTQPSDIETLRKKGYVERAELLINSKFENSSTFGVKDPRMAKLLPFWKEVFDRGQFDQYYILALRNPLSVAESLAKRDSFPATKSYFLWLDHVLASLLHTQGEKRIVLDYDRLLQKPAKELERVAKSFDLQINAVGLDDYITNFLDGELRHTRFSKKEILTDVGIPSPVGDVYSHMLSGASDKLDINNKDFGISLTGWMDEYEQMKPALLLVDDSRLLVEKEHESASREINGRIQQIGELLAEIAMPDSKTLKEYLTSSWYLQQNQDVIASGVDPYEHWLAFGKSEGRLPSSDPLVLAHELFAEREQSQRRSTEEKDRELRQVQHESLERQKALEAEISQQFTQLQQSANQERTAQIEAAQHQMNALAEQHGQRENSLRVAIEEKDRELRQVQHESLERQKALEAEIAQTKLKARYEVETQLRALAERERVFAEQLTQLQQAASHERVAQVTAAQQQMSALAEQHAQREQSLRDAIDEKDRVLRQVMHESLEQQKALEAEVAQAKLKARYEVDAELRTLVERERAFAEQLVQLQEAATQERAILRDQYFRILIDLNNKLGAIQSTWSWRLTAPLRSVTEWFGMRLDVSPVNPFRLYSVLDYGQEAVTISTENKAIQGHVSTSADSLSQAQLPSTGDATLAASQSIANSSAQDRLRDSANNSASQPQTLDELLALQDEAFVNAAYRALLKRNPDAEGFNYYLNRLRKGVRKLRILDQLRNSPEGQKAGVHLAGVDEALKNIWWQKLSYIGQKLGRQSGESARQLRKLESQISEKDKRFDQLEKFLVETPQRLGTMTAVSNRQMAVPDSGKPSSTGNSRYSFDAGWYLRTYQDVVAAGIDPHEHYLNYGKADGRFSCQAEHDETVNLGLGQAPRIIRANDAKYVFDPDWYLSTYPDVAAARLDPLEHYLEYGQVDGRFRCQSEMVDTFKPDAEHAPKIIPATHSSYAFDADWYLQTYPDVAAAGADPLVHYLNHGKADGRFSCKAELIDTHMPHFYDSEYEFDAEWYRRTYPDVSAANIDPLVHFVKYGWTYERLRCKAELVDKYFLDTDWYRKTYPDVVEAGYDPLEHYLTLGRAENRQGALLPLAFFDCEWYLSRNPDVAASGVDPLQHYINEGKAQGRQYTTYKDLDAVEAEPMVFSQPLVNTQVKLIAFYLPQFHPIPENDTWWGKGFTEWTNVSRAKPFSEGHDQPRLPGELGSYDLRLVDVMKRQAELARAHGVYGFCFYIYWFGGKRLLESPVEMLLRHPEIDINFSYCWANENWTRRWDGLENDVLIGQSHSPEDDIAFISSISAAFKDKRYIRVDGKPMLTVYRPGLLPNIKETVQRWRKWCRSNGIGEIHVCFTESFDKGDPADMGMDASIEFPPSTIPHQEITHQVPGLDESFKGQVHNYMHAAKSAKSYTRPKWEQYRGVMPSWDNTARKMERGISFHGATPELYAEWLDTTVTETKTSLPEEHQFVFINAWNEWGEGAYLEPDRRRGYAYLNRTREVMAKCSDPVINQEKLVNKKKKTNDLAVIMHLHYGDLFEVTARYLDNLSGKADLYFSVRDGCFPEMVETITQRYPEAVVVSYPNHGRDV
ncbi:MAG: glycoside hydrolase family 99-like domain-containing protein, partial [Gallionella sp.]